MNARRTSPANQPVGRGALIVPTARMLHQFFAVGRLPNGSPAAPSCSEKPAHSLAEMVKGPYRRIASSAFCGAEAEDRTAAMTSSIALWRDARGRLSALRIATLALLFWPILLAVTAWQTEVRFEARPINNVIH